MNNIVKLFENVLRTYLEISDAYNECSSVIKGVIDDMLVIWQDPKASEDEKHGAIVTIFEALFPSPEAW